MAFFSIETALTRGRTWSSRVLVAAGIVGLLPLGGSALAACGDSEADIGDPTTEDKSPTTPTGDGTPGQNNGGFGTTPTPDGGNGTEATGECTKMDIVFVVDDSGSMAQEQANLTTNFPKFSALIDAYTTKTGQPLDYRLAVTTTDPTKNKGAFKKTGAPKATCAAGPARPWLERNDGKVADFFSCRAEVGTAGSASERPLASLIMGLTSRIEDKTNTDNGVSFIREDALLAFVVLTDEDESFLGAGKDGLPKTIGEYPALFDKVKGGDRAKWASAIIAGEKSCSSPGFGNATEAKQLKAFSTVAGKNAVFSSICTGDLTDGLTKALDTFGLACKGFSNGPK